jgi:hypothetical protein
VCDVIVWSRWCVAGAVVVLVLAGCGDDSPGPVLPPVPSSGSPSASASRSPSAKPTGTAEEQILAQYRRFWTEVYPAMMVAPAGQRRAILQQLITQPLLKALLETADEFDRRNQESRGAPQLSNIAVSRRGNEGMAVGCVDFTNVPLVDKRTGEIIENRPLRVSSQMNLKRGPDGVWRGYRHYEPREDRC